MSIPLETIEAVEVVQSPRWGEDRGAIAVAVAGEEPRRVEFERIAGGEARAMEIAGAIRRQQELVSKASS